MLAPFLISRPALPAPNASAAGAGRCGSNGGGAIQLPVEGEAQALAQAAGLLATGLGRGEIDVRAAARAIVREAPRASQAQVSAPPGGRRTGCEDVRLGGWRVASQRKLHRQTPAILGLLDIGTSKTVCFIVAAARRREAPVEVLGVGQQPSRGLKAGVVIELDAAEQCVRAAVTEAERAAGCELRQVLLAVASGRLKSTTFAAEAKIEGRAVGTRIAARLMSAGQLWNAMACLAA